MSAVRSDLGKKARKALGCEVPGDAPPEPAGGEEPPAEPAEGEEGYVPPEPEPSLDDPNFLAACRWTQARLRERARCGDLPGGLATAPELAGDDVECGLLQLVCRPEAAQIVDK